MYKRSVQQQNGVNYSIEFSGIWPYKFLKLYGKRLTKFEQVSKKVPTPRTLELLAFDTLSICANKAEVSEVDYSSKANSSNVRNFLCSELQS